MLDLRLTGLICSILMELSPNEEPVWTYFDAQHKYIINQMGDSYNSAVAVIKGPANHLLV